MQADNYTNNSQKHFFELLLSIADWWMVRFRKTDICAIDWAAAKTGTSHSMWISVCVRVFARYEYEIENLWFDRNVYCVLSTWRKFDRYRYRFMKCVDGNEYKFNQLIFVRAFGPINEGQCFDDSTWCWRSGRKRTKWTKSTIRNKITRLNKYVMADSSAYLFYFIVFFYASMPEDTHTHDWQ